MTRDQIRSAVTEIIHLTLHAGAGAAPGPELRLAEDLGLDSIQLMALVVELENRFKVCFEPEDEQAVVTLEDLVSVIQRRLEQPGPA